MEESLKRSCCWFLHSIYPSHSPSYPWGEDTRTQPGQEITQPQPRLGIQSQVWRNASGKNAFSP